MAGLRRLHASLPSRIAVASIAALMAGVLLWLLAVRPPGPPRRLVMATGPAGGTYWAVGPRYRQALARSGIDLELRPTAGAVENLARLGDPRSGVDVGFVEAGLSPGQDPSALTSLGSVLLEPLWIFHRGRAAGPRMQDLPGRRLSIGPQGSGSRELALRLLALDGADPSRFELHSLTPEQAAEKLTRREIDAAAMVTSFDSPVVRRLVADPEVTLASFPRADAFVALHPYLEKLVLPAGTGDLGRNLPPADVVLFATKASLVVRRDLDPGLQYLLLEAAAEVHGGPGVFHRAGRFPAAEAAELPLSEHARHFYKSGTPWLQRRLPFGLAMFAERWLLWLVPLAGIAYPLLHFLPAAYQWGMRQRVLKLYRELRSVEATLRREGASVDEGALSARLDALERHAHHLRVARFLAPALYTFRQHLDLVRGHLRERAQR